MTRMYQRRPVPVRRDRSHRIRNRSTKMDEDGIQPGFHRTRRYWSLYRGTKPEGENRYTWKRTSALALTLDKARHHWQTQLLGFALRVKEGDEQLELRPCPPPTVFKDAEYYVNA